MRLSLSTIILSFSILARADFYLAASETEEFSVGEPKAIQWNTADFEGNINLFVGPEDANEDDDNAGTRIATDYPNSGSFNYTPTDDFDTATFGKKKKKIWGHDKKKKGGKKGKKLIIIIVKPPGYKPKEPIEKPTVAFPPVILPTQPIEKPTLVLPSVILPTIIAPPIETPAISLPPPIETPATSLPPVEKPSIIVPPVIVPTLIAPPPFETPKMSTLFPPSPSRTLGTILPTGTGAGGGGGGVPSPPIFTGAASIFNAKPFLTGGIMGLLAIGMF